MQLDVPMAKAAPSSPQISEELVERFRGQLDQLVKPDAVIGVAVSGGPDSLALLLLAAAARPGLVEAATVDHALRREARAEAEMVAGLCQQLGIPHAILTAAWEEKPETAIQERARIARYRLLSQWARERGILALVTAHHLDDQAETFMMRLARGAGVRGLGAMRAVVRAPTNGAALVRPLLGWRRSELEQICTDAGLSPAVDQSNADDQFERVRIRKALANIDWVEPQAIARSAANLAQADVALHWATDVEWGRAVKFGPNGLAYTLTDAPREIRRRIVRRAVLRLATEGNGAEIRGPELERLVTVLTNGGKATLRGVQCVGGKQWRFAKAPARRTT